MLLRMRYGFYSPNFGGTGDPRFVAELGARAEAAGWDGFFLWDHLAVQPAPLVDPWVALAGVAARTERIVLGPLIVPLARRRPQKVALEAVSLARLAAGRFVLGGRARRPGRLLALRRGPRLAYAGCEARRRACTCPSPCGGGERRRA